MDTDILVLGAGMIGVGSAIQLARRGHSVCLLDRGDPGREASHGNAGIIQSEALVPYPFPRDWATLGAALLRRSTALHYQPTALPGLVSPLLRYWKASTPARHEVAIRAHSALIAHAASEHERLVADCGAQALVRRCGYHAVFRSARAFDAAARQAIALQQRFGVRHAMLGRDDLARAEPALRLPLVGAIHWPDPLSVTDPGALVTAYAQHFQQLGGRLVRGEAATLEAHGGGWQVQSESGVIRARHAVLALGAWSGAIASRLGYRLPLFVKRGYHRHFTGGGPLQAPMLDAERGLVLVPMRQGIRLTTGAEFARLGAPASAVPMERATRAARELLDLPHPVEPIPWLGNRPCTADMLPILGAAPRHRNLWFNFGHAHQGFTLGAVCGRLIAELIEGAHPLVDPTPYAVTRF